MQRSFCLTLIVVTLRMLIPLSRHDDTYIPHWPSKASVRLELRSESEVVCLCPAVSSKLELKSSKNGSYVVFHVVA